MNLSFIYYKKHVLFTFYFIMNTRTTGKNNCYNSVIKVLRHREMSANYISREAMYEISVHLKGRQATGGGGVVVLGFRIQATR